MTCAWSRSHTHGIPPYAGDEEGGAGGPRVSIALLCAAARPADPLSLDLGGTCSLPKRAKNIYHSLLGPSAVAM